MDTRDSGVSQLYQKMLEASPLWPTRWAIFGCFGLMHSSGPYGQDDPPFSPTTYDSEWDVMSGGGRCSLPDPEYDCVGVHTIAYHKDFLGWIPSSRKYVAPRNSTRTITLERLAQPDSDGYLMAQIPIGDSPTDFYTVETRLFAGYDDEIPDEAVVIHKVDTTREDRLAQVVDIDNNGDPNDEGAMWTVGEVFLDRANNLQVSIDAANASGYRVTINTNPATFRTCIDFLAASSHLFGSGWDGASVQIVATESCNWSARSNNSWLRITAGSSGVGAGTVSYTVAANPGPTARTGTLTIDGWTFTVIQAGADEVLFADDMERGTNGWDPDLSWALTTTTSRSGTHAWTSSEGVLYSLPIDLTEVSSATLTFWHRYEFSRNSSGIVVVHVLSGESYISFSVGFETPPISQSTWQQVSIDLTPFVGQAISFSFPNGFLR